VPRAVQQTARTRRSTYLGILLYRIFHETCSDEQKEYVAYFQSKLNFAEVLRAMRLCHSLTTNPVARKRLKPELWRIPTLGPRPHLREKRRIGVGYRDKGSLRERHRPVLPGELTLGSEAEILFGYHSPQWLREGHRKRADEVLSEIGSRKLLPGRNYVTVLALASRDTVVPLGLRTLSSRTPRVASYPWLFNPTLRSSTESGETGLKKEQD
jgi:hypothetical protein